MIWTVCQPATVFYAQVRLKRGLPFEVRSQDYCQAV